MSNRVLPSSKKVHSEKHKQILKQLLKEGPNKTCVDCKTSKNPRWASWNLGCFICIRCSGIHRSMGTHISKVKSVDLDAWTEEQIESMVKWGNEKANLFWEAKLPDDYVPNESKIENFIRTKYDLKKWAASTVVPNPMSIKSTTKKVESKPLFDDDFGSFTSSPSPKLQDQNPKVHPQKQAHKQATQYEQPQAQHAPIQDISVARPVQSAQSTGGSMNARPDLKKSILSLYSSPSSSTSLIRPVNGSGNGSSTTNSTLNFPAVNHSSNSIGFASSSPSNTPSLPTNSSNNNATYSNGTSVNNLSNSLSGLSFGNGTYNTPPTQASAQNSSSTPNRWNSEWNDSSQWKQPPVAAPAPGSVGLDDDLFKNVWG